MTKKYYIMARKQAPGCPENSFYYGILVPDFSDINGSYGRFPWYAGPKRRGGEIPKFPEKLILMEKERYRYNVCKASSYFFVISEEFNECLHSLKHGFSEIKKVDCVDKTGKLRPERNVSVASYVRFRQEECLNPLESKLYAEKELAFEKISFKDDWDYDVFYVAQMSSRQASLFCSEDAKNIFDKNGVIDVEYISLENINPPIPVEEKYKSLYRPESHYYSPV